MEEDLTPFSSKTLNATEDLSGASPARGEIRSTFFGQILVEVGALRHDDLRRLVERQREVAMDARRPVGWLAVDEGLLDEARVLSLLDQHGWRLHLGELLVMRGRLSLKGLTEAIQEQGRSGGRLGDVLLRLKLLDDQALAEGLAEQCGVAFVPIAHVVPNPELTRWVNAAFARTHGLVPILCRGRCLTIAAWQPRSLALASDIEQATGLDVNLLLTTRQEVEERIRVLYPPVGSERRAA